LKSKPVKNHGLKGTSALAVPKKTALQNVMKKPAAPTTKQVKI